jgi:uncharacterized membrane protein
MPTRASKKYHLANLRRNQMSKTDQLLIGYYATVETAEKMANTVKEWDKNLINIDLGAMGIMTMDKEGKIKTEKIGDRAAGKGAKWGLIAGAVTGIFTGGLTLVGGAIAGVAIGAVTGALFHRGLGMSDEEKDQLEAHLKDGGAALAVITPVEQVSATYSVLNANGDEVVTCRMDEQTMADIEAARSGVE